MAQSPDDGPGEQNLPRCRRMDVVGQQIPTRPPGRSFPDEDRLDVGQQGTFALRHLADDRVESSQRAQRHSVQIARQRKSLARPALVSNPVESLPSEILKQSMAVKLSGGFIQIYHGPFCRVPVSFASLL